MERIKIVSEYEMVLAFLQGEINSQRFSGELKAAVIASGADENIIINGDIFSDKQNLQRREILAKYRGYPDKGIFDNYPKISEWVYVRFSENDLDNIRYIDYSYWNEISKGTSRPREAAKTVLEGKEAFGVSNSNFLEAAKALDGHVFPPVILIGCDDRFVVLEGHLRLTAYALREGSFEGTYGFVGFCSREELIKKESKMLKEFE